MQSSDRAGKYIHQPEGYKAFIPTPLPPTPPIKMDPELSLLLSRADQALARLDGLTFNLPNPDLFVYMYVRYEAVLSSQIEGTQSSLDDLLKFEVKQKHTQTPDDVTEVSNHVQAMNYGLERLSHLPLSLRLIREIHEKLMNRARGSEKTPGEFRRSQNWIGPSGSTLQKAIFIPPPTHEMNKALNNFEKFLHDQTSYPILVQCGLVHAQFETIHPFLDGNGRMGRLLITFMLCQRGVLRNPLLYLSHYLKKYKGEYYDRLMAVRNSGDWEGWLKFFLKGIEEISIQAKETAEKILDLKQNQSALLLKEMGNSSLALPLFEKLFFHPYLDRAQAEELLDCSTATATTLLNRFTELGLLEEVTGRKRYRFYRFSPLLDLFMF